jgi:hypothetical protein
MLRFPRAYISIELRDTGAEEDGVGGVEEADLARGVDEVAANNAGT